MAIKLNTSVPSYCRIENGKVNITIEILYAIVEVLETDLYEIFSLEKNISNSNNVDNVLTQIGTNHSLTINLQKDEFEKFIEVLKPRN